MLTREDILKEYNMYISFEAPPKPPTLNFNKFYWWRRYPVSKPLDKHYSFISKINHGDFDYSPYAFQISYEKQWLVDEVVKLRNTIQNWGVLKEKENELRSICNKRIRKLQDDFEKDERERMNSFKEHLKKEYGGNKEQISEFIENSAEGTLLEVVEQYKTHLKNKKHEKVDKFFSIFN